MGSEIKIYKSKSKTGMSYRLSQKKSNAEFAPAKAPIYLRKHDIRIPVLERPFVQCTTIT